MAYSVHCSREGGRQGDVPGRKVGFKGAQAFAKNVINAVKMAQRKEKPTLYGRLSTL